ncbi:MAG: hypothetical protein H0V82_04025 [Candidatus Protochlamydia sp.]|nr:hypothetical protein [Candidatus Protochlamydia sp.]
MKQFRIATTSLFAALLCMTSSASANELNDTNGTLQRHHQFDDTADGLVPHCCCSKRGPRGCRGRDGRPGIPIPGPVGAPGLPGIPGLPGVSGESIPAFISAFEVAGGTVVPAGTNILWSTPPPPATQHIVDQRNFLLNAAGQFISTAGPGNYEVFFGALWSGAAPFQLYVNGLPVPGAILNPPNDDFASMSIIVSVANANPTFEIRNTSSTTAANLNPGATNLTTGAFITIKKIS